MDKLKIIILVVLFASGILHSMDDKKIVLCNIYRNVSVLYINDYILPFSNSYEALKKEGSLKNLFFASFISLEKIKRNKKHKRERACFWISDQKNIYENKEKEFTAKDNSNDIVIEMPQSQNKHHEDHDFLKIPKNVRLCIGNVICGAGMFSIVMLLTFYR